MASRAAIKKMLTEIMGDFPTEHLLNYHADTLEGLLAKERLDGKVEAFNHIKKDLTNYGVTEADYVMDLYADILKEDIEKYGR